VGFHHAFTAEIHRNVNYPAYIVNSGPEFKDRVSSNSDVEDFPTRSVAYSTDTCHSFHVKPATQTAAKLPPDPRDVYHPAERSDALFTL